MNSIEFKLQNILFPTVGRLYEHFWMFYQKEEMVYNEINNSYHIKKNKRVEFSTYFNAFSIEKWLLYSKFENFNLKLKLKGYGTVKLLGYSTFMGEMRTELLERKSFDFDSEEFLDIQIPLNSHSLVGFEIDSIKDCEIYEGFYYSTVKEDSLNDVDISLVTVTFNKEDFIIPNMKLLKEELLEKSEPVSNHLDVYVIDNGRSLTPEEYNTDKLTVIPNNNVGGAGGFTRGIIEAHKRSRKVSHILLMDDDVIVLPESINRTYALLASLKEEHKGAFISGAMLFYEKMNVQHEDVGFVNDDGSYGPLKLPLELHNTIDVIRNEENQWDRHSHEYAGWWYCCIPADIATLDNLPLPLFIRGDDVEYSLRNTKKFITMNGICLWHQGFTFKFNAAMELYQVHRNSLIIQAISGIMKDLDFIKRIVGFFRIEMMRFNYNSAELLLDAIDDYLKGPDFIMSPDGESIMKSKFKLNEKLEPLVKFKKVKVDLSDIYNRPHRNKLQGLIYKMTLNGHMLPAFMLRKEPGVIAYDWFNAPMKQYLRRKVLAVNPHLRTAAYREMSKKRFFSLYKRYRKVMKNYKRNHVKVEQDYKSQMSHLTSYGFWKSYLEMDAD